MLLKNKCIAHAYLKLMLVDGDVWNPDLCVRLVTLCEKNNNKINQVLSLNYFPWLFDTNKGLYSHLI